MRTAHLHAPQHPVGSAWAALNRVCMPSESLCLPHFAGWQRRFKYTLSLDGIGCSTRFQKVLATGQVRRGQCLRCTAECDSKPSPLLGADGLPPLPCCRPSSSRTARCEVRCGPPLQRRCQALRVLQHHKPALKLTFPVCFFVCGYTAEFFYNALRPFEHYVPTGGPGTDVDEA